MATQYESKDNYPPVIVEPPKDVEDGSHTVASLQKKHDADAVAYNEACASTGTSKFTDGTVKAPKYSNAI
jgi:hypothetical protein